MSRLPPTFPPGAYVDLPGRGRAWTWDSGGSPGPAVVLLHGWTSTAALTWCRCFGPLRQHYRVVAMDLRGHGRGIRSRWPFRLEDCADDVAALIGELGLDPVVAVGYSMGGPVAQLLWRRHPEVVAGLVLCATAASFPRPVGPEAAFAALGIGVSLALSAIPSPLRQEGFRRLLRIRPDRATMAPWARQESESGEPVTWVQGGVALGTYDATGWIGAIDVPTAAVVTGADTVVDPARQRAMADAIPGSTTYEIDASHRACADAADLFVPALLDGCRTVTAT